MIEMEIVMRGRGCECGDVVVTVGVSEVIRRVGSRDMVCTMMCGMRHAGMARCRIGNRTHFIAQRAIACGKHTGDSRGNGREQDRETRDPCSKLSGSPIHFRDLR